MHIARLKLGDISQTPDICNDENILQLLNEAYPRKYKHSLKTTCTSVTRVGVSEAIKFTYEFTENIQKWPIEREGIPFVALLSEDARKEQCSTITTSAVYATVEAILPCSWEQIPADNFEVFQISSIKSSTRRRVSHHDCKIDSSILETVEDWIHELRNPRLAFTTSPGRIFVPNLTFFNREELICLKQKTEVVKLLRCPICFAFGKTPYFAISECGHAICCNCDSRLSKDKEARCCLCKEPWKLIKEHQVKSFPADYEKRDKKA